MDPSRYDIVPIGISHDGRWYLREDAIKLLKEWAGNAKLRIAPSAGAAVKRLGKP